MRETDPLADDTFVCIQGIHQSFIGKNMFFFHKSQLFKVEGNYSKLQFLTGMHDNKNDK